MPSSHTPGPPTKIPRENTLQEEVLDLLALLPLEEYELAAYVFATFAPNARRIIAMSNDFKTTIERLKKVSEAADKTFHAAYREQEALADAWNDSRKKVRDLALCRDAAKKAWYDALCENGVREKRLRS